MKKEHLHVLWILTVFLSFSSCQKVPDSNDSIPAMGASEWAKEWYYADFKKTTEYKKTATTNKKIPDWEHFTSYKVGNTEVIEFPLIKAASRISVPSAIGNPEDKKRIADASLCRVSFIRYQGKMTIREVDYIPDLDYLKAKHYDISDVALGKPGNDFSGRVIVRDWNGIPLSLNIFSKGKITKKGKIKTGTPAAQVGMLTSEYCSAYEICEYFRDCEIREVGDGWYMEFCSEWQPTYVCWIEEYCEPDGNDPCEGLNTEQCVCQLYGYCGGGDGTTPLPTPCEYTSEEGQEMLNSITSTISDVVISESGTILPSDGTGKERKPTIEKWGFVSYHFFGGYNPKWVAFFKGVVYRNSSTDQWKWETLTLDKVVREGSIPPCFTTDMNATVTDPVIQADKRMAITSASWSMNVSVMCMGNLNYDTFTGNIPSQPLQAN